MMDQNCSKIMMLAVIIPKYMLLIQLGQFLIKLYLRTSGAIGGLNFSVNGQKLAFTRDVSGFEKLITDN
jgi:hypothetical protein